MNGETAVPAQNRTVVVAIVIAALALGAFAVVGIGVLLGWIPRGAVPDAPPASAPAKPASNGLQKFSGTEPLMPRYSQPNAPPPAPVQGFEAQARPAPPPATMPAPAPVPAPAAPPAAPGGRFASGDPFGPAPPSFDRVEPRPSPAPAPQRRDLCSDCGRVIGVANWRSGWEMRVRFEDGSTQTFRFRRRPPFELGDRVRLDGDELISD